MNRLTKFLFLTFIISWVTWGALALITLLTEKVVLQVYPESHPI